LGFSHTQWTSVDCEDCLRSHAVSPLIQQPIYLFVVPCRSPGSPLSSSLFICLLSQVPRLPLSSVLSSCLLSQVPRLPPIQQPIYLFAVSGLQAPPYPAAYLPVCCLRSPFSPYPAAYIAVCCLRSPGSLLSSNQFFCLLSQVSRLPPIQQPIYLFAVSGPQAPPYPAGYLSVCCLRSPSSPLSSRLSICLLSQVPRLPLSSSLSSCFLSQVSRLPPIQQPIYLFVVSGPQVPPIQQPI
jgi:hypothetical protein